MPFTIINEAHITIPTHPYEQIKDAILGRDYALNLIFTTSERIKQLNTIYRDKEQPTDILSFPLSENEGEIYISEKESREEAVKFNRPYDNFIGFLFIHGCTHLKGHDHGDIMEKLETDIRTQFGI